MSFENFDHPCKGTCSGWQQGFEKGQAVKDKVIAEKVIEQTTLERQERLSTIIECAEKIASRDAMIEKLENTLKYYSDEKNWYDVNHGEPGKPVIKMVIGSMDTEGYSWTGGFSARKSLAELEEWKKSNCITS